MRRLTAWRKLVPLTALLLLSQGACSDDDEKPTPTDPTDPTDPDPVDPIPALQHLADWPRVQSPFPRDEALEARIDALVKAMTLEEKVGQMTQPQIDNITPEEVKQYHIGSVLNGGGNWPGGKKGATVEEWLTLADAFWAASMDPSNAHPIPIMWGTDAVHGHNNVRGATMFPHNIGLGAARDPELLKRIGEVTASEVARTGIDWAFGPTVAVVRDDRWGRTYEGYSEDPQIVAAYAGKITEGLQGQLGKDAKSGEKVAASVKHFLGDGATTKGKDQGITVATEDELRNLHGHGYFSALKAGAQTVMISFSSWQNKDQGENAKAYKMHGHKYLMTDVLKDKVGFDGFYISDWNGIGQITKENSDSPVDCSNKSCPQSINAGMDMIMVPYRDDWKPFITNTLASVRNGEISEERINDAVRRILRVKFRMGLFDKPKPSERTSVREVGTAEHRAVAREAVRKSLVLLKNNGGTLPLERKAKILVAGKSADSLSNQAGGWSLTWQGTDNTNEQFGGGTTLWAAIQKIAPNAVLDTSTDGAMANDTFDAAVVVIGETPYAEGVGDIGNTKTMELAKLRPEDLRLIESLKAKGVKKIVTVLFSGRPLHANKEINRSDAFVAAWLPGTEGDGMADVLFRKEDGSVNFDFTGKLSYSWPKSACQTTLNRNDTGYDPLYAYGHGLTYASSPDQNAYPEESPTVGCGVETPDGPEATLPLVVYDRGNQDGWVMRIGAPSNWAVDVTQGTGNPTVTPNGEVTATPVDDRNGIQWAAVRTTWVSEGQVFMQSANGNNTRDLRSYLTAGGSLVFDARLTQAPVSTVKVRVDCVHPCVGEVDVTQTLKALSLNAWNEMAIPLQCFADAGTDFSLINTPIVINSLGAMELAVANVRWEPKRAGNVTCNGSSGGVQQLTDTTDVYVNGTLNTALFGAPTSWSSVPNLVKVNAALDTSEGKVIDVVFEDPKGKGGNGVFTLPVHNDWLLDVSPIAATGGVQFDIKVLDYGTTTQNFWVKLVCNRKADTCRTGDLKDIVTRPPAGTWTTLKLPFVRSDYEEGFDNKKLSSILEMLPAWDDQAGNIHFQLRNIRVVK
ncbi:exo 1,3/1,4-beta-D-glucan glucohydrolase [Stigmatella sp. ncwal1]|uniref:Exo 1,3/1,4-beta-D-glucan glucohydrolase n=1 Tax=Stigmatella ashevillensis TaxID=2995309 RepID=A0ABT5D0S5_9BACT|nr:exo 1,3/1,4-beta-D-glucan glucohydrolase [Stigmatella ashevillena]MDC0707181.1 exo 1,3/1,4-beta-D-glucan glucohydrolase [Stigmatella ashevillena]